MVLARLLRFFGLDLGFGPFAELDVREAAVDDVAKHAGDLVGFAIEPGLMGELESDAAVADPADGAFDRAVVAQVELDPVPDLRFEIPGNHCSAARKIEQLDVGLAPVKGDTSALAGQSMAVAAAAVAQPARLAGYNDAAQLVGLGALGPLAL